MHTSLDGLCRRTLIYNAVVSYENAFQALKDGDFQTAAPLLEKAAAETAYASDVINHACTLALHHLGDKPRLAEVAFRVGQALSGQDPASAMDYFQRAMFAGLDAERERRIGELFEGWATPNQSPEHPSLQTPVTRVAHVVGCLLPSDVRSQYLKMLVSSLRRQGVESTIFTTESAAAWFFNPANVPQSQPVDIEAEVKIASLEGDFEQRAARIADALRSSGVAAAFFHANLTEQITARVASMRPAPLQIHVDHDSEMDADLFHGRIHLFESAMHRTRFSGPAKWIPLVSDIEARLQMCEPVTRRSMGLESATSVSATFGNLHRVSGREYLHMLAEILNRFPKHFHLFAGPGNVKTIRSYLHSEGVLPRVRFLGQVGDVAPLLEMIDVYLASFPDSGPHSILEPMAAAKPVVVLRFAPESGRDSAAELVGIRELTAAGVADYVEITDRLLRNPALRAKHGQAVLNRFRAEFRPDRLGERYKAFLGSL